MRYTLRAALAVALLVGFYVVAIALAVGLVALVVEAAAFGVNGALLVKFGFIAAVVAFAIFKGLFAGRKRDRHSDPGGMPVNEQEQPAVWAEVRALSAAVGTRVPDEIRLVADVNAAVSEDSRFLGLVPGTRRLYLGVPLLFGLSRGQVRSVLAHELGHYSGRHTALGPITYRGKEAIARVLTELGPGSYVAKLLALYGRLYYAVAHSVGRRQELEADEYSARLAGREAAASALRDLAPLGAAWGHFVSSYASLGEATGHRPDDLFVGFAAMLRDPATVESMDRIRAELPEPEPSVYDTHPPVSQRIAAIEATTDVPVSADDAPGHELLVDLRATLNSFEQMLFGDSGRSPERWEDLVQQEGARQAAAAAQFLAANADVAGGRPAMAGLLDRLATPGGLELERGATPEQERAFVARLLGDVAADSLVRRRAAAFQLSWSEGARLVAQDGTEIDPWTPAQTAAESSDTGPFRSWAASNGVDLDEVLQVDPDAEHAGNDPVAPENDEVIGVLAPVRHRGTRSLVVTHRGVLLAPVSLARKWGYGFRVYFGGNGAAMARTTARTQLSALAGNARTIAIPWPDVVRLHVVGRRLRSSHIDVTLADESNLKVKFDNHVGEAGEPLPAIAHYLGQRFGVQK